MKKSIILLIFIGLTFVVFSQKQNEVFRKQIIPLNDSISINNPNAIIPEAFLTDIAKHNIVAMGEVTHGIREFHSFRFAIFKELAEKYNFRVFMIESPMMWALAINSYVQNGDISLKEAITGKNDNYNVLSLYMSDDFVSFIKWMHDFNLTHSDKIVFYGFDNQMSFLYADTLIHHAYKIDSSFCGNNFPILKECSKSRFGGYDCIDSTMETNLLKELDTLQFLFKSTNKISVYQKQILLHYINVAMQDFEFAYKNSNNDSRFRVRDKSMFENIRWGVETYAKDSNKVFVMAHNIHLCMKSRDHNKALGVYMYNYYGKRYFPIGLDFTKGEWSKNSSIKEKKYIQLGIFQDNYSIRKHICKNLEEFGNCYYFNIDSLTDKGTWIEGKYRFTQFYFKEKFRNLYRGFIYIKTINPSNYNEYKYQERDN